MVKMLTLRNGQGRTPLVSQDVQTDATVGVDVRVVDLGREADLWRFEGVVGGEGNGKEEHASSVWRVTLTNVKRQLRTWRYAT